MLYHYTLFLFPCQAFFIHFFENISVVISFWLKMKHCVTIIEKENKVFKEMIF